jgi:tetratricopeptide (TPR) repeat protein
MNNTTLVLLFYLLAISSLGCSAADREKSVKQTSALLNNEAVRLINIKEFLPAIDRLNRALKLCPHYPIAKENLSIAHNNFGLSLIENKPLDAIEHFHQALNLTHKEMSKKTTLENIDSAIIAMGKDPQDASVRTEMGDQARANNDLAGAVVEYRIALKLRNDPRVRRKLTNVYSAIKSKQLGSR